MTKAVRSPFEVQRYLHNEARQRRASGWVGVGWTGYQKCPSIFLILCSYMDHVHVYAYTFSKVVRTYFLLVQNFGQVGGLGAKIQKHPVGVFFKSY